MGLDSVDSILDFAIHQEEKAADFYKKMAERVKQRHMKEAFLGFANEEMGHRAKLLKVKAGEKMLAVEQKVLDLKIGDYLEDAPLSADVDYRDALVIAMKAEKAAFKMYSDLASVTEDADLKGVLLSLAQEEAKHKLRFEVEYDSEFLKEN